MEDNIRATRSEDRVSRFFSRNPAKNANLTTQTLGLSWQTFGIIENSPGVVVDAEDLLQIGLGLEVEFVFAMVRIQLGKHRFVGSLNVSKSI